MLNILVGTITMAAALRMAVPLILSSIGGCFGDRTGIFNIALESFMLCAAFFATLGTYYSGSPYVGVLCGILAGLACAVLFGTLVFHLGSSGMVVSIAMNLGMDAFTSFLLLNLFGKRGSFMDPRLVSLPVIKLPLISRIPYARGRCWAPIILWCTLHFWQLRAHGSPCTKHPLASGSEAWASMRRRPRQQEPTCCATSGIPF